MKSKDQQLLEEAYNDVVKKMMQGANNPGFDPQDPFSGIAFKAADPKWWPKKKKKSTSKQQPEAKEKAPKEVEDEIDVEGEPVGSHQYIPEPQPEEDHSASMMFLSNADIEKVYQANEELFDSLFKNSEGASEESGGIVFRYIAPQIRQKMEQAVQNVLK